MKRQDTVQAFRERLDDVIERSGLSRAAFAKRLGIDRSTLAQILSPANNRLPRAETLAAIAADQQVSIDWLLGLSQEGALSAAIIAQPFEISTGEYSPADERLTRWHAEAAGYKVRYVPSTLPDLLKTEEFIRFEYRDYRGPVPESRIEASTARLENQRRPETDLEVCCPLQTLESFARGENIWRDFPLEARRRQLEYMIRLVEELYPTLRWFLFDGAQLYSVPLTVFGPIRAAVYCGHLYLVFNSTEHIRVLAGHFDTLIRHAVVQPPDMPKLLQKLLDELSRKPRKSGGNIKHHGQA
jgi:transcriptional regulator with XRE-family HTH domain